MVFCTPRATTSNVTLGRCCGCCAWVTARAEWLRNEIRGALCLVGNVSSYMGCGCAVYREPGYFFFSLLSEALWDPSDSNRQSFYNRDS